ncbi:MAG: hypothetical protein ACRD43_00940, partial [Pyrinomonadaceae bacterium]
FKASLENCGNALVIQTRIVDADPKNAFAAGALGRTRRYRGNTLLKMGNADQALAEYRVAAELFDKLLAIDPTNASKKASLAESYSLLGDALSLSPKNKSVNGGACEWFQKSLTLWQDIGSAGQLSSEYLDKTGNIQEKIANCELAAAKSLKSANLTRFRKR